MKTNMRVPFSVARKRNLGAALLLVLLAATLAHAQLNPSDDAYVNTAAPTTNYGAAVTLNLQSAADTAFIRFDLTAVPAGYTGSSIAKATLKLYVNSVTTAGSFNVDYVTGTWVEKTITHNLQPAIGTTIAASVPLTTTSKGKYVEIDVTAALVEWLNGTQANDGIALVANSPLVATFDSKENTSASHAPELDLVYAGIAGVTTANGSGLTGGGTSGTLNLSLLKTCSNGQVLKWNGSGWACATANGTGTITGVTAGVDLTGGGTSGNVTLNLDTTRVPQLSAANTFVGNQSVTGNLSSTGTITGQTGVFSGFNTSQIVSVTEAGPGTGITSTSLGGIGLSVVGWAGGVYSSSTAGIGVVGVAQATTGPIPAVEGAGNSPNGPGVLGSGGIGVQGVSIVGGGGPGGSFSGFTAASGSLQSGTDGVDATGGNGDTGVASYSIGGNGVTSSGGAGFASGGNGVTSSGGAGINGGHGMVSSGAGGGGIGYGGTGVVAFGGKGGIADGIGGGFAGGSGTNSGDGINVYAGSGWAGFFSGNVDVTGSITAGGKDFKIDHPLDPANKYLYHASVESSEMMNIYTGNITTDAQGEATVQLPNWFEVLNTDFRYQLTVIGQFAQAIVAHEIQDHQFQIRTNTPNVKVSWQVTGVRQDAYAKAHPLVVEQEKDERLRGFYIHPELYGAPDEKQIEWARHPEMMKQMKELRDKPQPAIRMATLPPVIHESKHTPGDTASIKHATSRTQ